MSLEKYKVNDGNHLPSIGDGRFKVYSKQFNELVNYIDTIHGDGGVGLYDIINEYTTGAGCTVEGVLLKDSNIELGSGNKISFGLTSTYIGDNTTTQNMEFFLGNTSRLKLDSTRWEFKHPVRFNTTKDVSFEGSGNINTSTVNGLTLATTTAQKLGFWGVTPIVQPAGLTANDPQAIDATYGVPEQEVLGNVRTRLLELETRLKDAGLLG